MPLCLLGLGSNQGDPARSLPEALARLQSRPQIELLQQSRFRQTRPIGGPAGQAKYLNAAAVVRTSLSPMELLRACQEIENDLGRRREERWGPRTLDIDLLLYDDLVLNEPELQIPHPRMAWRRFVLEPAAEIAAEMVHPVICWTVGHLLYHLNSMPWYLAVGESIGGIKHTFVAELAQRIEARLLIDPFKLTQRDALFCYYPSGHKWQIDLEFLKQRARQLDKRDPAWATTERATVSDFWSEIWYERSAACAKRLLPADQYAEYMAVWKELRWHVVRPRLRVMLVAPPPARLLPNVGRAGQYSETCVVVRVCAWAGRERMEWSTKELEEPAFDVSGPVLWLDPSDTQAALMELTAAVEAMR